MSLRPALLALLLAAVPLQGEAPSWDILFTRPAFLITKPTSLHTASGQPPEQILRPSARPVPLRDDSLHTDAAGSHYRRLKSGEFLLVRTPPGAGTAESKGRLIYLPERPPLRPAVTPTATALYARPTPAASSGGALLPAGQALEALYAAPLAGHTAAVFVRHAYGSGWVLFEQLQWQPTAAPSTAAPPAIPSPLHRAISALVEHYNQGVQRSRAYYLATTGHDIEARTFDLGQLTEKDNRLRLHLRLRDGHLALPSEAVLARLLVQELGRPIDIEWP